MSDSDASDENEATGRLPRVVVDFKIPLPWLLAAAGSIFWGLIGMWFKLAALGESVADLQIAVKAGTATTIQYASEQTLIEYRLKKLEAERDRVSK